MATIRDHLRFDSVWWRKFAYLGSAYAPDWFKSAAPPLIGALIFALKRDRRTAATANMLQVLGTTDVRAGRRAAREMFACFASCLSEAMEFYSPNPRDVRLDAPEDNPLARALERGHGAVVVTAHFGNWDLAAKAMSRYSRPINVVMGREANATTHEYVRDARERAGVRVIYSDTSVFASLNMIRALQRNEIVAMQLDRVSGPGVVVQEVPFFGRPAPFPVGPFALARLSGAPLIPVYVPRRGRRHYEFVVGEVFSVRRGSERQALPRVMSAVVAHLESVIRADPQQWFQFAPFWNTAGQHAGMPPAAPIAAPAPAERAAETR